jgi:plasmid stability protein
LKRRLRIGAAENGRSMEEEARAITMNGMLLPSNEQAPAGVLQNIMIE